MRVLDWSREQTYSGYSKHDALNSKFLHMCSLNIPFLRLVITQVVMRSPINIRPWLGVPKGRNPKGIGLFAHAYFDLAESTNLPDEKSNFIKAGEELLAWLLHHASPHAPASDLVRGQFEKVGGQLDSVPVEQRRKGLGWGYHYPWQDQGFFQPRHYPNRVVTSWIGFAFLRAYELTGHQKYLDACREIVSFLVDNPRILFEDEQQLCLSYVPLDDIKWAVMDVSALTSSFLAQYVNKLNTDDPETTRLRSLSRRLMAFVVDKQTDYGAWFYTWPAKDSHIEHDNYHTAIILDCLADYMSTTGDIRWEDSYRRGLDYYREALFLDNGAPRWMNNKTYPHDIHGAASGILCFTNAANYLRTSDPALSAEHMTWADTILKWTEENLSAPEGYFFYQKTKTITKKFCLMRWCNAWMSRALAQRLRFDR